MHNLRKKTPFPLPISLVAIRQNDAVGNDEPPIGAFSDNPFPADIHLHPSLVARAFSPFFSK